ncbi:MAG TPA: hypothetical protein VJR89_27780 [Polyangiales bacterium]|nr:hypothetical protein [Polyangiales bacterium]
MAPEAGKAATAGASGAPSAGTGTQPKPAGSAAGAGAAGTAGAAAGSGAAGQPVTAAGSGGMGAAGASGSPATGMACDRACLTGFNDAYLQALVAKDATKLATAPDVRFTENGKQLSLKEGLWAVASKLRSWRQDFAEVPAGQTAGFVALDDDAGAVLLAFRMKIVDRKVTELETTVCRRGQATFFSPDSLTMRDPIYDMEVEPAMRQPRAKMIETVDMYFQALESGDGSKVPFDSRASRNENGTVTASGASLSSVAQFSYIDKIERRYVLVDEERGNVLPWVLFQIPMGIGGGSRTLHLAELFKVSGGKIMKIHAVMVNQPFGTPGGWQ